MDPLLTITFLALAATVIALVLGLISMSSTTTNAYVSTPLMWARVGFQAFTIALLIVAVLLQN